MNLQFNTKERSDSAENISSQWSNNTEIFRYLRPYVSTCGKPGGAVG
jgi:hypothetical protein